MLSTWLNCCSENALRLLIIGVVVLTQPASAQVPPGTEEISRYTGLHAAAQQGNLAQIGSLVTSGNDINARDAYGRTPLHVATFARQREAIRALITAGARTDLLEHDRYDAVTIAAVADDEETLRILLSLGASAKLITSRYDGTALIAAGAPFDHVNNLHWTALIESIVLGDGGRRHVETLRALVEAGANTQLADRNGATPLALAKARGYEAMVEILRKTGAR